MRHPRLYRPLNLANERVYLMMVLLLHQSARIGKDGLYYWLESALAYLSVHKYLDRICLHLQSYKSRCEKTYEVQILHLPQLLLFRLEIHLVIVVSCRPSCCL